MDETIEYRDRDNPLKNFLIKNNKLKKGPRVGLGGNQQTNPVIKSKLVLSFLSQKKRKKKGKKKKEQTRPSNQRVRTLEGERGKGQDSLVVGAGCVALSAHICGAQRCRL